MTSKNPRIFIYYTADDFNAYAVWQSTQAATAVGNLPALGLNTPYPRYWQPRYIRGATLGDLSHVKIVIGNAGNPLFTSGGVFLYNNQVYEVIERVPEIRTQRQLSFTGFGA